MPDLPPDTHPLGSLPPDATFVPDPSSRPVSSSPSLPHLADPTPPGYELLGELGRGGMGVVYHARQVKLNREVALKMILGQDRADEKAIIRFLAEAEAVASVRHPNVVQVYEYGEHDGRPYLAMEYVGGGSLSDRLKAGPLPPADAAALLGRIAAGVQAAHDQGIVHRDLKPGNVLLQGVGGRVQGVAEGTDPASHSGPGNDSPQGTAERSGRLLHPTPSTLHPVPKVTDFGLAKRAGSADMTRTNAVMGTPAYMAPEQAKGESKFVGPPADVYALGAVFYECLTGAKPFDADDTWALLRKVMNDPPEPPRKRRPDVPRDLELICLKCLEKEPHRRYPTAAAFAADLDRYATGQTISARPARAPERVWRWARRNPTLAVAAAVMLLLAGGLAAALADGYQQAVARADAESQRREQEATARQESDRLREQEATARQESERLRARAEAATAAATAAARRASQVSGFLGSMFESPDPLAIFGDVAPAAWEKQRRKTAADFLRDAAVKFRTELVDQPLARADLLATVGTSLKNLGLFVDAEPLLAEALALRTKHLPPDHPDTAQSEVDLGRLHLDWGNFPQAVVRLQSAEDRLTRGGHTSAALTTRMFRAWALTMLGKPEAERLFRDGLALRTKMSGPNDKETLIIRVGLIGNLIDTGKAADAAPMVPGLMQAMETQPDNQVKALAQVTFDFQTGVMYRATGGDSTFLLNLSEQALRTSLTKGKAALPDDHMYMSLIRHELGATLLRRGKGTEAEELFARVVDDLRKTTGLAHPKALVAVESYTTLLADTKRVPAARKLFDEVDAANRERFGPDNHWRAILLGTRAEFEADYGEDGLVVGHVRETLRLADAGVLIPTRQSLHTIVDACRAIARRPKTMPPADGRRLFATAVRFAEQVYGRGSPVHAARTLAAADWEYQAGDPAASLMRLDEAERMGTALGKDYPPLEWNVQYFYRARSEAALGRLADAETHYRKALALSRGFPATQRHRHEDATGLASVLADQGKYADAVPVLAEAWKAAGARPALADWQKVQPGLQLATVAAAATDRPAQQAALKELAKRTATVTAPNVLGEYGRAAGLDPTITPAAAAALAARMEVSKWSRVGYRSLALLKVRAGAKPAEVLEVLSRAPGELAPKDVLVYGLSLAKVGEFDKARSRLWRAALLRPTGPTAYRDGYWLDRVEEKLLAAELAALLPPTVPERGPVPRSR